MVVDDINTLLDPKASTFDKTLAAVGFIPVGKFVKGGKLIIKLTSKEGRYIERSVELSEKNLKAAKALPCNCFTAGTKVQTDEGEKPIEDIEVGDKVLAKSDETGEVAYKEVVGLFQKQAEEIYYVHIGDEIIEVTGEHPFWLDGKGWTFVKDLKVGDLLVSSDGSKLVIDKIEKEPREATVYNFEVADFHSYFVSNLGIWVHNCFTNISFQTNLFKNAETHMFSANHVKDGIMKLGSDRQSIFNSITRKIGSVDPAKLQKGSNQMHTNINGRDVTVRFYVNENGTVINVNAFMGTADRVIGNLVK
ncbi:polymorphic toxin-type HINT domain-containing protein [Paenibacillus kribbensis]|uniref:polymorphic toxin-type HINT domain-containing protein n=1 Tax=Paenibacillus kribbensis TaxID=172713 RepID=UPI00277B4C02|nr:polymorphic toxin-type HINT domain-containing protein [Paenibacillus kribbensis]